MDGLPQEDPLADEAIIIRFGVMTKEKLRKSVNLCRKAQGYWGLSFYGENEMDEEEIAVMAQKGHGQMQMSRKDRINVAGFDVERKGRYPHLTLRFASEPTDEELEKVMDAFDAPIVNPHPSVEKEMDVQFDGEAEAP